MAKHEIWYLPLLREQKSIVFDLILIIKRLEWMTSSPKEQFRFWKEIKRRGGTEKNFASEDLSLARDNLNTGHEGKIE